jgi:dienelactone hydrolase
MGQSFGGATAIALAWMNPEGVQAAINFAGGGGGSPESHPRQPCSESRLREMFAGYGKTARLPTLWLYSENDMYWGPTLPREWFDAFKAAGGQGEFQGFPPVGDDGHRLFSRAPQLWQPRVRDFLISIGYPPLN